MLVRDPRCTCEPIIYSDGSVGHEQECALFPWCPHEVVAATCLIPCGCSCKGCRALDGDTTVLLDDIGDVEVV